MVHQPAVAPIIKDTRIPRQLQAVFLASARGELIDTTAADKGIAFKVFKITQQPKRRGLQFHGEGSEPENGRGPRLLFAGHHTKEFDKSKPVSKCMLKENQNGNGLNCYKDFGPASPIKAKRESSRWIAEPRPVLRSHSMHRRASNANNPARRRGSR